jgi:hypothetical protein
MKDVKSSFEEALPKILIVDDDEQIIADIYRNRYKIKLFFKAIKQEPEDQYLSRHQSNAVKM